MKDRIKAIRKAKNLTQEDFARDLGVSITNIKSYETDRRKPSTAVIQLICNKYGVNETWLLTGNGDMFAPLDREQEIAQITASIVKDNNPVRFKLQKIVANLTEEQLEMIYEKAKEIVEDIEKPL